MSRPSRAKVGFTYFIVFFVFFGENPSTDRDFAAHFFFRVRRHPLDYSFELWERRAEGRASKKDKKGRSLGKGFAKRAKKKKLESSRVLVFFVGAPVPWRSRKRKNII